MVRDGWNFHNDIAIDLERIARIEFGYCDRPYDTIHDAQMIESSTFVEVMIRVLRLKTDMKNDCKDIEDFVEKASKFFNQSSLLIEPEDVENFLNYLKHYMSNITKVNFYDY